MADPTAVKRALRALAYDTHSLSNTTADDHLIGRATAALDTVDDAAQFCESTGLPALQTAVHIADEQDKQHLAQRGRRTVSALLAYKRAANGPARDDDSSIREGDHFHSGRGTPLSSAGQGGDR